MWCSVQIISPFDVYLNSTLVLQEYEVWRLITNFFYFGKLGIHLTSLLVLAHYRYNTSCRNWSIYFLTLSFTIVHVILHCNVFLFEITCTVVFSVRVLRNVHSADLDFLFHMFFLARYCKLLEETSFRGRTADFFFMLLFGGTILTTIVVGGGLLTFAAPFADILFLSNSLTFMMVCSSTSYHRGFCCSLQMPCIYVYIV